MTESTLSIRLPSIEAYQVEFWDTECTVSCEIDLEDKTAVLMVTWTDDLTEHGFEASILHLTGAPWFNGAQIEELQSLETELQKRLSFTEPLVPLASQVEEITLSHIVSTYFDYSAEEDRTLDDGEFDELALAQSGVTEQTDAVIACQKASEEGAEHLRQFAAHVKLHVTGADDIQYAILKPVKDVAHVFELYLYDVEDNVIVDPMSIEVPPDLIEDVLKVNDPLLRWQFIVRICQMLAELPFDKVNDFDTLADMISEIDI